MKYYLSSAFLLISWFVLSQSGALKLENNKVFQPHTFNEVNLTSLVKHNNTGEIHIALNSKENENIGLKNTSFVITKPTAFNKPYSIISKYTKSSNLLWHRLLYSNTHSVNQFLEVDSVGNIYTSGFFRDSLYFVSGGVKTLIAYNSTGINQFYLFKISPTGDFLWCRYLQQGAYSVNCNSLSVNEKGQVACLLIYRPDTIYKLNEDSASVLKRNNPIPGMFNSSVTFGCLYFNTSGHLVAEYQPKGVSSFSNLKVIIDKNNSLYLSGKGSANLNFYHNDSQIVNISHNANFLLKLSENGSFLWSKIYTAGSSSISNVMFNSTGNSLYLFLVNSNNSSLYFPLDTLKFAGDSLGFSAGYTPLITCRIDTSNGEITWLRSFWARLSTTAITNSNKMFIDNDDNIYLITSFNDRASLHTDHDSLLIFQRRQNPLAAGVQQDENLAIVKIQSNGSFSFGRIFGDLAKYQNLNIFAMNDSIRISGIYNGKPNMHPGADTSYLPFIPGSLGGFFLTEFAECIGSVERVFDSICDGQTVVYNGLTYSQTGVYQIYLPSQIICDSIILLNLHTTHLPFSVNYLNARFQVQSSKPFDSYQWFECLSNNSKVDIFGANSSEFYPLKSGQYGVRVTRNNCMRESACNSFISTEEYFDFRSFKLYPNPAKDLIYIDLQKAEPYVVFEIYDIAGRMLIKEVIENIHHSQIDIKGLPIGTYTIIVKTNGYQNWAKILVVR